MTLDNMNGQLLLAKESLLQTILTTLLEWDKEAETAPSILKASDEAIAQIKRIDAQLSAEELDAFKEEHKELMHRILTEQQAFIKEINSQSTKLSNQMKQMNQRKQVVHGYMDKEKSLFVDREV
ncbi:hypothetical protein [Alkalibacterium sp. MB6]|uniref:hypothetical protein n=1 Tax=Alkalibacterium sp. MB6 TaxID=2081965 RepID=UPI00137B55AA|nr:hypothetical protein [Alkalibacterium sp. MB6]